MHGYHAIWCMQIEDTNSANPIQNVKDIVADAGDAAVFATTEWLASENA